MTRQKDYEDSQSPGLQGTVTPGQTHAFLENKELCQALLEKLASLLDGPFCFMEVCGTHTVSIFRSGLRSLLPKSITHLSGPGCPVCVTHEREIAAFIALAQKEGITITTFGDLLRVPGPKGMSLKKAKAEGADIQVVYSPLDALAFAAKRPDQEVVFLGVGFETTAPAIAATIKMAQAQGLRNFSVLAFHKLVPPALNLLLASDSKTQTERCIDAFLLPGHVSAIIGLAPYAFIPENYQKSGVVGGFEPAEILEALITMQILRKKNEPAIVNNYSRVVSREGNPKAMKILYDVFTATDALWRGIGLIPESGLTIRPEYERFDAMARFALTLPETAPIKGCQCGEVLKGILSPDKCALFGKACTPATPVGPCMVSSEGSCAAYFKYGTDG